MRTGMIYVQDYDEVLHTIGTAFLVSAIHYVSDLVSWSKGKGVALNEPSQSMKLFTEGKRLMMFVQSEIHERVLDDIVRSLGVRWSLKDNVGDPSASLNSVKKRLAYCFLKEYARTLKGVAGNELLEDEWAMKEMERLGFFRE
jgi:hypothetical protein